ncbi:MAG: septal ring lytic transglycosylase RlpA family protein [Roseibium sp.]
MMCIAFSIHYPAEHASASTGFQQCGEASWYKLTGKTASGEPADPSGLTGAHRTLPFGTMVDVTNISNGRTVTIRINDRGPFSKGRIIDVTQAAAQQLGFISKGITTVKVTAHAGEIGTNQIKNCQ